MNQSITVIFDGKVLQPEQPLALTPNQKYKIIIESETELSNNQDGWDVIESLIGTVDAPEDWAMEHDHYLYGLPKKYNREIINND